MDKQTSGGGGGGGVGTCLSTPAVAVTDISHTFGLIRGSWATCVGCLPIAPPPPTTANVALLPKSFEEEEK